MEDKRKEYIAKKYLLGGEVKKEEFKELSIQEVILLIYSSEFTTNRESFKDIDFDKKLKVFRAVLKDKIINSKKIYIAYNSGTNYPHIDYKRRAMIFSEEGFANASKEEYLKTLLVLEIKEVVGEDILEELASFHRLGISGILIDNGKYTTELELDFIVSNSKEEAIFNPEAQYSMIKFFQELYSKSNYEGKGEILRNLKLDMDMELKEAEFIVKIGEKDLGIETSLEKEGKVYLDILEEEDKVYVQAFTDVYELIEEYSEDKFNGVVLKYSDLIKISEKVDGVIINPCSLGVKITTDKEDSNFSVNIESSVAIKDAEDYPEEIKNKIKNYIKKNKNIDKAYLRCRVSENTKSYVLILDVYEEKQEIIKAIKKIAELAPIEIVEIEDWDRDDIKKAKCLYKKKKFLVF